MDFSTVYYDADQRLLVPSNSPARSIAGSRGQAGVRDGASTPIQVIERCRSHPLTVDAAGDRLPGRAAGGPVDAISTDDSILVGFKAQDPYTKIVGPSLADVPYGMAISKAHPDFVRFVNGVLARCAPTACGGDSTPTGWAAHAASTPAPPPAQYDG